MIIQDNLKYHQHITTIIKKLQPLIQSFKYANKLLPTATMRQLYFIHIYPHLINAIAIWGTNNEKKLYIQPLIQIQKKIIRLMHNAPPRAHTKPMMKELNILNIINLYTLRTCIEIHPFIFPTKHHNRPTHNHLYIHASHIHEYPTRYSSNHQYIPAHTHRSSPQPSHHMDHCARQYATVWNSLPSDLQAEPDFKQFKRTLNLHLMKVQNQ